MDGSGMSRADFIRACISALEERGDVAAPADASNKQPNSSSRAPKNSARAEATAAAGAVPGGMPRGMILPAAAAAAPARSQSKNSEVGGRVSPPGSLKRASPRPPLPVHSVLSRIRDRNTAPGSVNAADLKHAAESVARWVNDFERDHRSLRTFVAQFSVPKEEEEEEAGTAAAAASAAGPADARGVAPCSVEFLDSLSAFCDEADADDDSGDNRATMMSGVARASQSDATTTTSTRPGAGQSARLSPWSESVASLAAVLCVKLPLCLGRFEKVLLRKNFAGVFLGEGWRAESPEQARTPSSSSQSDPPPLLLHLREALVAAGSLLPLEVIGAVPSKFWKQNQLTDGVLRLQALQLDLCEAAAQRRRVWSRRNTAESNNNHGDNTAATASTEGNDFGTGASSTARAGDRDFWVAEYNFLQILREVAIGRSDMRTSIWKAVADWTSVTLKQEHDRLQAESLDVVACESQSRRSGSLGVACVYAASQFTADLLRGMPRATMRKLVETGAPGRRILEAYWQTTDAVCRVAGPAVWFRVNEDLLRICAADTFLAAACLKSGVVLRNVSAALADTTSSGRSASKGAPEAARGSFGGSDARQRQSAMELLCAFGANSPSCREWMSQVPSLQVIAADARYGQAWGLLMCTASKKPRTPYTAQEALVRCTDALGLSSLKTAAPATAVGGGSDSGSVVVESSADEAWRVMTKDRLKAVEWAVRQLSACQACLPRFPLRSQLDRHLQEVCRTAEEQLARVGQQLRKSEKYSPDSGSGDSGQATTMSMKDRESLENEALALRALRQRLKAVQAGSKRD